MLQVVPFGSHVSGLQMHFSDIDVVVTGVLQPDDEQGGKQVLLSPSCLQVASAPVAACFALDTLPACTVFQVNGIWHQHSPSQKFSPEGCQPDCLSTLTMHRGGTVALGAPGSLAPAAGFRKGSRGRVAAHLRRIVAEMRRKRCIAPVRDGLHIIAHARMPIVS